MNAETLRDLSPDELEAKSQDLREQLLKLRFHLLPFTNIADDPGELVLVVFPSRNSQRNLHRHFTTAAVQRGELLCFPRDRSLSRLDELAYRDKMAGPE